MLRNYFLWTILSVSLALLVYVLHETEEVAKLSRLTFDNTQVWHPLYSSYLRNSLVLIENSEEAIILPQPPENTSTETKNELTYLHTLSKERTDAHLDTIMHEITITNFSLGDRTYSEITDPNKYPKTAELFRKTMPDLETLIFIFKDRYNRVRPSFLDPTLSTAIEVPRHPAYPSGHATQSYFIALIMSELRPDLKDAYIRDATQIAHNREIAGLHYPSDSEAGRVLAQAFFDLLQGNETYQQLFMEARKEWSE